MSSGRVVLTAATVAAAAWWVGAPGRVAYLLAVGVILIGVVVRVLRSLEGEPHGCAVCGADRVERVGLCSTCAAEIRPWSRR